jgi:hypothetical protein
MQEMVASKMDCLGSPRAAPNVGLMQGMVALADCLGILAAAPNVGPTQGMVVLVLDGLRRFKAALNASVQPAMSTPTGDTDARVTVL